jgi:DNA-binding transcriptional MerR regulator
MKVGFTPAQVTRLTGVAYSTLNLWAKNGLVRPSIAAGTGSGNERIYSFSDIAALKVAVELRKAGINTRSLQKVVNYVRSELGMEKPLGDAKLIVSGHDVLAVENDEQLVSTLSKPGQGCLSFVVDLPRTLGQLVELAEQANVFGIGITESKPAARRSKKAPAKSRHAARRRA